MSEVALFANGREFTGWKSVAVERGIDQACGRFKLSVTQRQPGSGLVVPIEPDSDCRLVLDGTTAITGVVDRVDGSFDARRSSVDVEGRDYVRNLIDCSAYMPGTDFGTGDGSDMPVVDIVKTLAKPYGIGVKVAPSAASAVTKTIAWDIEPGEAVWDCISRHLRLVAVIPMTDGLGNVVLTRAGKTVNPNALVEGVNIRAANFQRDHSKLFGRYIALGQDEPSDQNPQSQAGRAKATVMDAGGPPKRVLMSEPGTLANNITLNDHAILERDVHRAKAVELSVTVAGFSANGRLWQPNELVPVQIPRWDINRQMLIRHLLQTKDRNGTRSELTLVLPGSLDMLPEPEKQSVTEGGTW